MISSLWCQSWRLPVSMPFGLFPHAPEMPVTVNGGMRMPAWYDILAMNIDRSG